jgi:hypothetical protein|tara:strand:- start:252 stop:1151 length:900 start_codon:yes stop_codon:yes gene_type:complete
MSRTLKRPMFRKGGEVMEGIMTGIKPRESFQDKGMSDAMRSDIENIQGRINLIDAIAGAGASPLANPLTQFLLQTGQNLIGGTAAGGTKLQEIVGATKDPLNRAIKAQQLRDLSKRKIAGTLLSKMGTGGLSKYIKQAKDAFRIDPELAKRYNNNAEKYALELFDQDRFRQGKSGETLERESRDNYVKNLMKVKDNRGNPAISQDAGELVYDARKAVRDSDQLKKDLQLDPNIQYVPKKAGITKDKISIAGKERTVYRPKAGNVIDFQDGFAYFEPRIKRFLIYKEEQDIFIPYGGYKP